VPLVYDQISMIQTSGTDRMPTEWIVSEEASLETGGIQLLRSKNATAPADLLEFSRVSPIPDVETFTSEHTSFSA